MQLVVRADGRGGAGPRSDDLGGRAVRLQPERADRPPRAGEVVLPDDFGKRSCRATPGSADVYENTPALAQASIGQNDVSATPLQMALVAAGGGQRRRDHVAARDGADRGLRRCDGQAFEQNAWTQRDVAGDRGTMRQAMIGVVQGGHGDTGRDPGVEVGGQDRYRADRHRPAALARVDDRLRRARRAAAEVAVAVLVEGQDGSANRPVARWRRHRQDGHEAALVRAAEGAAEHVTKSPTDRVGRAT